MKLMIRSHEPAWDAEYEVHTEGHEIFRVKTSHEGNYHRIHILDSRGIEAACVYQDRYGVTGVCRGREILTVELVEGLYNPMIPVIRAGCFGRCIMQGGDIRRREYFLSLGGGQACVYPSVGGTAVRCMDHPAQPLEILTLVLAIEAIAQYT